MIPVAERLLSKTVRAGDCLLFTGHISKAGYGRLWDGAQVDQAHRISYRLFVGPIPDGHFVCHRCDVRSCVEPTHLFAAEQSGNMRDMHVKQRHSHGEAHAEAIRRGWTPELRARRAEQTRERMASLLAERRQAAGVPDDHFPCSDCNEWKPIDAFPRRADRPASPRPYCRPCMTARKREESRRRRARH